MKVAAIVPALNEQAHIKNVLEALLKSKDIQEVIVVDDGSEDKTGTIAKGLGAKVITLRKKGGSGKAHAMQEGVKSTNAQVIIFFDADLIGLKKEHIHSLIKPILEKKADMVVGVRGRWFGLPKLVIKLDPLMAIGGERAMKRSVFENMPKQFMKGFAVEIGLNFYCREKELSVVYKDLKGLTMATKEQKMGFFKGFKDRIKMIKQVIKARILTGKIK